MRHSINVTANHLYYKKNHTVRIESDDQFFCFIDYDDRSADKHMKFQHAHTFYEIFLLIDEEADHLIQGIPYALHPGDIVCLAPQVLHKSVYPKNKRVKRLVLNFTIPEKILGYTSDAIDFGRIFNNPLPIYRFQDTKRQEVFDLINDIYRFTNTQEFPNAHLHQLMTFMKLFELLICLADAMGDNRYFEQELSNYHSQVIDEIVSYIHNHYSQSITLLRLSDQFHLSPSHLSREFKRSTHFTLTDYLRKVRIKNAQYFLLTTEQSISQISNLCGFNSFSQFNRCFQRENHMSPREYRKYGVTAGVENLND